MGVLKTRLHSFILATGMSPYNGSQMTSILSIHRIIPLACGTLFLVLALHKARELWGIKGFSGSRLVLVLIRDKAFYYEM